MSALPGLIGGIGLFLLGMSLLTDGLKDFSGDALRRGLLRFAGTPLKAFLSGTVATLLVQSSSATTVTVIGFVSAGLLTFPQALGVVLGASLGTTGTSWIVAWIGLKIQMGWYALPLVGAGAFLRLLGRGRWKALGTSLAGFGLIFVGIDVLQRGMQGLSGALQMAALPDHGWGAHLLGMLLGLVMTVVMQSSSAAVATTLTALSAGAVNFEQASSLVIGAAVGTTVTGALAAIGGSVPAKRTALAHVLFNLSTGLIAIVLLPLLLWGIRWLREQFDWTEDATSLAAFHTAFIGLGVLAFLPFVQRFAAAVERLIPDTGPRLTRHLDRTLKAAPAVALEATRRALCETLQQMVSGLKAGLQTGRWQMRDGEVQQAIEAIQTYLETLHANPDDARLTGLRLKQLHAIDHLLRLASRLNPSPGVRRVLAGEQLATAVGTCRELLAQSETALQGTACQGWQSRMQSFSENLAQLRREQRPAVIGQTALGQQTPGDALRLLDGYRWLDRVGHHVWRACEYLTDEPPPTDPPAPPT